MKTSKVDLQHVMRIAKSGVERGRKLAGIASTLEAMPNLRFWGNFLAQYGALYTVPRKTAQQRIDWREDGADAWSCDFGSGWSGQVYKQPGRWEWALKKDGYSRVRSATGLLTTADEAKRNCEEEWESRPLRLRSVQNNKGAKQAQYRPGTEFMVKGELLKVEDVQELDGEHFYTLVDASGNKQEMTDQQLTELGARELAASAKTAQRSKIQPPTEGVIVDVRTHGDMDNYTLDNGYEWGDSAGRHQMGDRVRVEPYIMGTVRVVKVGAQADNHQYVHNLDVEVHIGPEHPLDPDALAGDVKSILNMIQPPDASSLSIEHCFAEVDDPLDAAPHMVCYASGAINMLKDSEEGNDDVAMRQVIESQFKDHMQKKGYPISAVMFAPFERRQNLVDVTDGVMEQASAGQHVSQLIRQFGRRGLAAHKAAQLERTFQPDAALDGLARVAVRRLAQAAEVNYEMMPGGGSKGVHPNGMVIETSFDQRAQPPFMWVVTNPEGEFLQKGKAETEAEAQGAAEQAIPEIESKELKKEQSAREAAVAIMGSADFTLEKMASYLDKAEYRAAMPNKIAFMSMDFSGGSARVVESVTL